MIKLVAFDWNGTILSDTNLVVKAESILMDKLGMPKHSLRRARDHFTIPIREYWIALGSTQEFFDQHEREIVDIFYENYRTGENSTRTRTNVRKIIQWLEENKIDKVIFSNHTTSRIDEQLQRLKLRKAFEEILARTDGDISHMKRRSKGEKLNEFVSGKKINPKAVITVGDTIEEVEIGKYYGYNTVAITGGNQSTVRLKNARPDFLINNLIELRDIITNIN